VKLMMHARSRAGRGGRPASCQRISPIVNNSEPEHYHVSATGKQVLGGFGQGRCLFQTTLFEATLAMTGSVCERTTYGDICDIAHVPL